MPDKASSEAPPVAVPEAAPEAPTDEAGLVERLKSGEQAAFEELVERYGDMLYRFALRMCGATGSAEDVLQDTFLTALTKINQFRGEGKLRNWLFRIAANKCLQTFRDHEGEVHLDPDQGEPEDEQEPDSPYSTQPWYENPAENLLTEELHELLEKAIQNVPATNRPALIMRDIEGLSTRETADALGISEEAVKVRLHRARLFVQKELRKYVEGKS